MSTTVKLLPVCECGHIIRNLEINQTESWCGFEYNVPFTPSVCPNCHQIIESMTIDGQFIKTFGSRKRDEDYGQI